LRNRFNDGIAVVFNAVFSKFLKMLVAESISI